MRRLRYGVAVSLDGFIAGPNGEYDWIVHDPAIDFAAMFAQYDTLLMGRRTFEVASEKGKSWDSFGQRWVVVSTTLKPEEHPGVTILSSGVAEAWVHSRRSRAKTSGCSAAVCCFAACSMLASSTPSKSR
jgi:dihydrofolate reductase